VFTPPLLLDDLLLELAVGGDVPDNCCLLDY